MVFKNNGLISSEIKPTCGICQGCPVSALIFILSVEILAHKVRTNGRITGIKQSES